LQKIFFASDLILPIFPHLQVEEEVPNPTLHGPLGELQSAQTVHGEARWLGVSPKGQIEQQRVMLLSAPFARPAGDAGTVGGLPPSAVVRATRVPGSLKVLDISGR
jgi:hypothetical protein